MERSEVYRGGMTHPRPVIAPLTVAIEDVDLDVGRGKTGHFFDRATTEAETDFSFRLFYRGGTEPRCHSISPSRGTTSFHV